MLSFRNANPEDLDVKFVLVSLKIQEIGSPFQEIRRFGGFPGVSWRMQET